MKKLILGAWIAVLGFGATAQENQRVEKTPEEMATYRVEKLKAKLELNDAQSATIKIALVSKMEKAKVVREKNANDKEAMKKEMEPIRQDFDKTMKSTLNEEQYAKWKEMHKKHRHHGKHHKKGEKCKDHPKGEKKAGDKKQKLEVK